MSEIIDITIKSNAPQVEKETTSLRQQVKELRKEMEACTVGTEEYNKAFAELATTMHDYKDQQEALRNSAGDLGTAFNNLQQVGTGIASGFSAVNAIMTLTGSESEVLEKSMVKLQAGIALVQGMQGLEGMGKTMKNTITSFKSLITATKSQATANKTLATSQTLLGTATNVASKAMKGFRTALISTGIGAIVVAVGALINGLGKLFNVIKEKVTVTNEFKDSNEQLNASFEAQNHALDNEIKLMKASGASQEEIIKEKQKLTAAQIKETEATLENARARLNQLKNDSAWTRFWKGENKVIKELEEKTIPELEATLASLNTKATDLTYEYKEAEINTQKDLEKNREQAANKAIQTAKQVAEQRKKFLGDVEKTAEESFKKILEEYKGLIGNIKTARESILSTNTVSQAISDIQAFGLVYGTDFNKFDKQLQGVQNALISDAIAAGAKERDRQLAEKFGDKDAEDKIKAEYAQFLNDLYDMIDSASSDAEPIHIDIAPALIEVEDEVESFRNSISDKAKAISEEFTNRFNALNSLYNDGVITYEEYFDTLQKVQNDYLEATSNFEEEYVSKVSGCEQRVAELRYQYALKPLELQKEVGEKFLQELDRQLAGIENEYFKHSVLLERDIIKWQTTLNTSSGLWSTSLKDRYNTELSILNAQRDNENEYYSKEKGRLVEELNNNNLTVEQRAGLWAQIEQLDADHLVNQANFNAKEKELNDEWKANLVNTGIEGLNAFASLTSALNSVSKAQVDEYKRQYEAGEISKEKFEKLQKEELEQQASLQIATTVMQTAAGIATVWAQASKLGIIAGPIIAGIQTMAYLANMAAQIKSIQTALRAGLAGDTSGGAPPDTSFTLTSPDAYQNTLSDEVQTDLQANAKDNQRVYVLESDITSKQDNVKSAVTTSTF